MHVPLVPKSINGLLPHLSISMKAITVTMKFIKAMPAVPVIATITEEMPDSFIIYVLNCMRALIPVN